MKGPLLGLPSNETHDQCWRDAIQRKGPADVPFHLGIALVRHDPFGADLFAQKLARNPSPVPSSITLSPGARAIRSRLSSFSSYSPSSKT
jgi:hypothetical protein